MPGEQRRMDIPSTGVQLVGEVGERLRGVTEPVEQQDRLARARPLAYNRLGAFDDSAWSDRQSCRDIASDPPRPRAARGCISRGDERHGHERDSHVTG